MTLGRLILFPVELSDDTLRSVVPATNIELIRTVKHFIVENVRSARRFLKRCDRDIDIDELTFTELNRHTLPEELAPMLAPIEQGHDIGIISDAGCPAIADPGADVVAIAQQRGYVVVPLVGPSSILLSLMASGFNGQSFAFLGYLPIKGAERERALRDMQASIRRGQTQIFIETPYRNNQLIADLIARLPRALRLCIASDITGARQSIITKTLDDWSRAAYDYDRRPTIFLLYR